MTYEKAKQKAKEIDKNVDTVVEYESAYVFYNSKARGNNTEDNEVVIDKDTGKVISYSEYVMTTKDSAKKLRVSTI